MTLICGNPEVGYSTFGRNCRTLQYIHVSAMLALSCFLSLSSTFELSFLFIVYFSSMSRGHRGSRIVVLFILCESRTRRGYQTIIARISDINDLCFCWTRDVQVDFLWLVYDVNASGYNMFARQQTSGPSGTPVRLFIVASASF